jgi:hypothetical protein
MQPTLKIVISFIKWGSLGQLSRSTGAVIKLSQLNRSTRRHKAQLNRSRPFIKPNQLNRSTKPIIKLSQLNRSKRHKAQSVQSFNQTSHKAQLAQSFETSHKTEPAQSSNQTTHKAQSAQSFNTSHKSQSAQSLNQTCHKAQPAQSFNEKVILNSVSSISRWSYQSPSVIEISHLVYEVRKSLHSITDLSQADIFTLSLNLRGSHKRHQTQSGQVSDLSLYWMTLTEAGKVNRIQYRARSSVGAGYKSCVNFGQQCITGHVMHADWQALNTNLYICICRQECISDVRKTD